MRIPIQISQHGEQVLGILHLPDQKAEGNPVVLMNYGLNGDRVDNHRLALLFAERANAAGITVLRFDYTGCGISDGKFYDTSIASKTVNSIGMIEFLKGCFGSESFQLILWGYSDGIRVSANLIRHGIPVAALCAWNPIVRSMTGTFKSKSKKMAIEPTTKRLMFPIFGMYMGVDYAKEANQNMPIEPLLDCSLPKLFVFGGGDIHTLEFQAEMKSIREKRTDFDYHEVPYANHIFNRVEWANDVVDHTVGWISNLPTNPLSS